MNFNKCDKCSSENIDFIYYGSELIGINCRDCKTEFIKNKLENDKKSYTSLLFVLLILLILYYGLTQCL